jgi:hypothetical protein
MELEVNGMIDGPPGIPGMTTAASRLAALRQYLDAWSTLNPRKETILPLKDSLGLYELYGGVHAIGSKGSNGIRCLALPSILRGVEAKEWELPHTDFKVRDFGMDPDQDLLFLIEFHQESAKHYLLMMVEADVVFSPDPYDSESIWSNSPLVGSIHQPKFHSWLLAILQQDVRNICSKSSPWEISLSYTSTAIFSLTMINLPIIYLSLTGRKES